MTARPIGSPRRGSGVLLAILVAALWLSRMVLPRDVPYGPLDDSWCGALGHALLEGRRAGVDYVFTFGPLGFLSTGSFLAELFWVKLLLWEGLFGLLVAIVLAMAGVGIENRVLRVLYFAVAILQPLDPDAQAFLPIAAALAWITRGRETKAPAIAVTAVVLAGLSLVKFTFAVAALLAVLAAAETLRLRGSTRRAAALVLAFVVLLAIGWVATGQSLADVPVYVARSAEMARGYAEAMSLEAPPGAVPVAIALIGFACAAAWIHARAGPAGPDRRGRRIVAAGQVAILLIVCKAGFVRASDHTSMFFLFAAAAPLLYDRAGGTAPGAERASIAARFACTAFGAGLLAVGGTPPAKLFVDRKDPFHRIAEHVRALLAPSAFRARIEADVPRGEESMDLPRTRALVGDRPIDMVSNLQVLLFRNGLRWTPRPVFQSYATFSPGLMELNARFLAGPRSPEYVLLYLRTIDSRLATMEDAAALQVLARDYEPVLVEKGRLLLRKQAGGDARAPREIVVATSIGFGETLRLPELPGRCQLLKLDIRATLAGRIAGFLDAAPEVDVEIGLDDGGGLRARIVPSMMRTGVIFDPTIRTQADWIDWCEGKALSRPASLKVLAPRRVWAWEPAVGVEIVRADDVAPPPRPGLGERLAVSIFPTRPSGIRSGQEAGRRVLYREEVVTLSADSEMTFDVQPGSRRVRGSLGVSPAADANGGSTAIVFSAVLARPGEPESVLFSTSMDPRNVPADRHLRAFEASANVGVAAKLFLRSEAGPGAKHDLACWSAISVE